VIELKRFFKILRAQVDEELQDSDGDWSPILETVVSSSELGAPTKFRSLDESSTESLEALGWTDKSSRGSSTLDKDADPAFNESLGTNQLAVNTRLMRLNVESLERGISKGLVSHEESLESLGSQIHDTRVQVGKDPGLYTPVEEPVWEGISGVNGKVDTMASLIQAEIQAEVNYASEFQHCLGLDLSEESYL
jgi:hypothetical protein